MLRTLRHSMILGALLVGTLSPKGMAMLVPATVDRASDAKTVQAAVESKAVRKRLRALGFSDQEIQSRLNRLSDKQIHQLAAKINALSPGGEHLGLLGVILVV